MQPVCIVHCAQCSKPHYGSFRIPGGTGSTRQPDWLYVTSPDHQTHIKDNHVSFKITSKPPPSAQRETFWWESKFDVSKSAQSAGCWKVFVNLPWQPALWLSQHETHWRSLQLHVGKLHWSSIFRDAWGFKYNCQFIQIQLPSEHKYNPWHCLVRQSKSRLRAWIDCRVEFPPPLWDLNSIGGPETGQGGGRGTRGTS